MSIYNRKSQNGDLFSHATWLRGRFLLAQFAVQVRAPLKFETKWCTDLEHAELLRTMDVCRGLTKQKLLNVVLLIVIVLQSMWIMYREKPPVMSVQTDVFAPESRSDSVSESMVGSITVGVTSTHDSQLQTQVDIRANFTTTSKSPTTKYLLLIMVLSTSSKSGRDSRDTIRKTWMQTCHMKEPPCLVRFVIGTFGLPSSTIKDLEDEQKVNTDLLLLTNLKDAYNNLTRKVLDSFVWADQNVDFSYLLKTDHDSFVFVNELHKVAYQYHQEKKNLRLYWGSFVIKGQVRRSDAKWAESNWFLSDHYLPYAFGGGYVISADLIHKIALTADCLQLYNNEDVSVGVWLSPYLIQRKNDGRFHTMPSGGKTCGTNDCLVWTSVSLDNMLKIHSNIP